MRFPVRSKLGVILSLVAILTVVGGFMGMAISSRGSGAHAASSTGVSYHTANGNLANQPVQVGRQDPAHAVSNTVFAAPEHSGQPNGNTATTKNAPGADSLSVQQRAAAGTLLHNFNGLSGKDNAKVAGILVHPPDQGLCVGHDATLAGNPEVEFEMINLVIAEYNVNGVVQKSALLPSGKENINNFFNEPNLPFFGGELVSDPRCIYDQPTDTFFLTALAACSPAVGCTTALESHIDLIVYNATSGAAKEYKIDDTNPANPGCPCLGDQEKIGVDNNAVYLSVDEFQDWAAGGTIENGADVYILSKSQLVKRVNVNFEAFLDISIGGIPVTSLQPAISTSATSTEFLANSFPFLADGENNPVAHTLGFWTVTGDSNVTSGNFGAVALNGKIINSESYSFPVLALSTGSGAPRSSAFLNPDDSRLQTCQFVSGDVWCSLSTSVAIKGDPMTRDGVAWFELSKSGGIAGQGYVASAGNYLIYPAIVHSAGGSTAIVFTLTSPLINPSAAYVIRKSGQSKFSGVNVAALGVDPSTDGASRWGDYSWATLDPNGKDFWMATEYIPPVTNQNPITNFGTRIFDVSGH
jgi:hypothetical protein